MTELGFHDWEDTIDRSYETILDPAARLDSLIREILRQKSWLISNPKEWMERTRHISIANIRHAMSGSMLSRYVARYDAPIIERIEGLLYA